MQTQVQSQMIKTRSTIIILFFFSQFASAKHISFEISGANNLPANGRMIVLLNLNTSKEPRLAMLDAGPHAPPIFGADVKKWNWQKNFIIDGKAMGYPYNSLDDIPAGVYSVQVLYDVDSFYSSINAPGNYYCQPMTIKIDTGCSNFKIILDRQVPDEVMPPSSQYVRYVKIQSKILSNFWKHPMYLRAGVLLPHGYDSGAGKRYTVRYNIGGYGARYTRADKFNYDTSFNHLWLSPGTAQMIMVFLDGEAPFGDSYQMNSANNGPYADATLKELIPYIEAQYHALATPQSRFLDGGSTGGWAALALQIYFPDFFNGVWAYSPDPVDFHYYETVNLYDDDNAYTDKNGQETSSARDTSGHSYYTIRQEVQMENVIARHNMYCYSGYQWGAWNAIYSPRLKGGRPKPVWDPVTGKIDHNVAKEWKTWDLKDYMATHWKTLGPKLQGKIHIWTGELDDYYLNNAVHSLDSYLKTTTNPKSDAQIYFHPHKGHIWKGITEADLMQAMAARVGK